MPSFPLGLIFRRPDPKEPKFVPSRRMLLTAAPWLDIAAGLGPYLDQADLGSCGPNSAAECISFDQKVENLPVVTPSRLFIYYQTRVAMGTVAEDSGVENKVMLAALAQYGFPPETDEPYVTSTFTQKPPDKAYSDALPNRISDYRVVPQDQASITGAIASGRPFILGFAVYRQIMSEEAATTGVIRSPKIGETPIGGHDMTACGYNLSGKDRPGVLPGNVWPDGTVKLRQHWVNPNGQPWGDGGYGYLPLSYALSGDAGDFWVVNSIPQPSPTPQPPPAPAPPPSPCWRRARLFVAETLKLAERHFGNGS